MKRKSKFSKFLLGMTLILTLLFTACGKNNEPESSAQESGEEQSLTSEQQSANEQGEEAGSGTVELPKGNYIELALNVYYNDSETKYYSNEAGPSIYVTKEGQYTITFDCNSDLSEAARNAGVRELKNLTAIYILDMGVGKGEQSPLAECNIMFDSVKVNGEALTITQEKPKSAFKGNGVFDTNDPINAWEGSQVAEVTATAEHVANFVGISNPAKVEVTFTLSDMVWADHETAQEGQEQISEGENLNQAKFSDIDFTSVDALTLTKYMGNGINLGNTMEAYGRSTLGTKAGVKNYETYWGQPQTTAEMFRGMKNCGFDSVRIPVAWTNMMNYEDGDYTINKAYMDRVEELVGYALDAEMFVIINDHWDGGWWAMFGSSTPETVERAWQMYESIWTQIAERFQDYSDMLIFESANEELGNGLNDNSDWQDSGKLTQNDCYRLTNEINQKFVDVIRKSGGNNDDRFLLIAGYNTDFDNTVDARFKMPTDTVDNKLLLSVHYYGPWTYCGAEKQARWGLQKEYDYMNNQFKKLEKFTEAGYGIIIGEYAALPIYHSDNGTYELKENTMEFTTNLLDNCDLYNYCPVLWSCNDFFQRQTGTMINEEIANLFLSRRYEEEVKSPRSADTIAAEMKATREAAPVIWEGVKVIPSGAPVAWIMWNGGAGTYSVGDTYNPADNTAGIVAHDVVVNGAGEYTVSLDFKEGNDGLTFAALAVANGESLFSKPILDIKEITVDGKKIDLLAEPYTASDDKICTRVNLCNSWVAQIPDDARSVSGDLSKASAVIVDKTQLVGIKNITITFEIIMNQ